MIRMLAAECRNGSRQPHGRAGTRGLRPVRVSCRSNRSRFEGVPVGAERLTATEHRRSRLHDGVRIGCRGGAKNPSVVTGCRLNFP